MALIDLPEDPTPRSVAWQLRDFGTKMSGGLGGSDQRINRLGNRWRIEVLLPAMDASKVREWQAKLNAGIEAGGVRLRIRQLDLKPGSPGAPMVAGASQSGKSLSVGGMTRGYVGRIGQYFSLISGGQRYGYKLAEAFRADGAGVADLAIEPALRVEPGDGDVLEMGKPYIEGMLTSVPSEETDVSSLVDGFQFTIEERR